MNVNYELYKVFFVVANSKTITEAAKKLYITQPAITKSIKSLESQLGITLFHRDTKGTTLTKEGRIFYNKIKPGIEQIFNAENELTKNFNKIKIGISDTMIQDIIIEPIKKIAAQKKEIEFEFYEITIKDNITTMLSNNLDIIILPIKESNLNLNYNFTKLIPLDLTIVGDKHFQKKIETLGMNNIKLICNINDYDLIKTQNNKLASSKFIYTNNYSQIYNLINLNIGIGIIPKQLLKNKNNDNLFTIPLDIKNNTNLYLITNQNKINYEAKKIANLIIDTCKDKVTK